MTIKHYFTHIWHFILPKLIWNLKIRHFTCNVLFYVYKITFVKFIKCSWSMNIRIKASVDCVSSAPVILDPNTADPQSPRVWWSDQCDMTARANNLFLIIQRDSNSYPCVLGSEGFNSGTHCWDVEVKESQSVESWSNYSIKPKEGRVFL